MKRAANPGYPGKQGQSALLASTPFDRPAPDGGRGGLRRSGEGSPRGAAGASRPATAGARHDGPSADCIERAQRGDADALEEILATVRPRVAAVAVRMIRDADEAEDVVQDALTKVWRNLARYEGRSAFSTWLHRIVVNTALDHLRARRSGIVIESRPREADTTEADSPMIEKIEATTPEDLLAEAEVGRLVRSAMNELSPVHRDVLAWRELEGESYQDIARLARCPVGTVMSRLHHARHRLAEALGRGLFDGLPVAAQAQAQAA